MSDPTTLLELLGGVVVLRDPAGRRARYTVDGIEDRHAVCSYVFRSRHEPPVRCRPGDTVELGAAAADGWLTALATVESVDSRGTIGVHVDEIGIIQRRQAYREEIVIPFAIATRLDADLRKGRTDNLSVGGFAARIAGHPLPDGTVATVVFAMPEGDDLKVEAEKVGGDIQQRFRFVEIHRSVEERFARMVRGAELSRRRARRPLER